eukprot:CAMPEP_0119529918 /NCGR_PEP_ID=MMETSP1344-20130328/43829_1 /TAXON_ID=236787 /ORGANISM="Florenciella parvula, Strain CCMP2471" /LENGTH=353 /DNA_ID=CAMNT_0007569675 /DNA_START=193 /DNA_END=1250 /DNA_ORIENTATION=-
MGLSSSRHMTLKESQSILGPDYAATAEGWRRIVPPSKTTMDLKTFQRYVVGSYETMPPPIASCIFNGFSSSGRGDLDFQDFVGGVAVLTRGNHEQRARLLFNIYDTRNVGYLDKDRLGRFLSVVYDDKIRENPGAMRMLAKLYSGVARHGELDVDEFVARVVFDGRNLVTKWIQLVAAAFLERPHPHVSALESFYNPSLDVQSLARQYDARPEQVMVLGQRFHAMVRGVEGRAAKTFSESQWTAVASKWVPEDLSQRIFESGADTPQRGWTVCDFTYNLMLFVRGSAKFRMQFVFSVFDLDQDGRLSEAEIEQMVVWMARHHEYRSYRLSREGALEVAEAAKAAAREAAALQR